MRITACDASSAVLSIGEPKNWPLIIWWLSRTKRCMSSSVTHSPAPLLSRSFCSHSRTLMSESDITTSSRSATSHRSEGMAMPSTTLRNVRTPIGCEPIERW
jgi:hypothetical protein